jgi:ATP-dependent Clp protease protease subunit
MTEEVVKETIEDDVAEELSSFLLPMMGGGQSRDVLDENGVIFLNGPVTAKSSESIIRKLWSYHFDSDYTGEINLILNSPGGYADAGWALIDTMSATRHHINTIAMGDISSMAVLIFVAGDTRKISENAITMIHHFSSMSYGNYPDLIAERKGHDLEYSRGMKHFLKHSKYNTETEILKNILKEQNNYLSPQQLKKHGLCDYIFKSPPRKK